MKEVAFIFFLLSTGDQKEDLEHDGQAPTSEPHLMPRRWFGFLLGNLWMIFGVRSDWRGTAFQAAPMGNEIRLRPWQRVWRAPLAASSPGSGPLLFPADDAVCVAELPPLCDGQERTPATHKGRLRGQHVR